MKKQGRLIEALQDGDVLHRQTARVLARLYYCDLSTIYTHIGNGKQFGGITFRWATGRKEGAEANG
jgi:hypothetical protein